MLFLSPSSQSNDAIHGTFNEDFLQRETINTGVFEFGADHNRRWNCHND